MALHISHPLLSATPALSCTKSSHSASRHTFTPRELLPAREINTSVVAAACLLHPRIKQPDGMRIHRRLVTGRRPGEIVPPATLTHELGGGARWGEVGDWEAVVAGLVRLVRNQGCDALGLGLAPIERALLCSGPDGTVRVVDPATQECTSYGP
ncbi:hypothetical protein, partial [Streptomyces sp. NPDC004546]|uniref:hypothetical protein n=1 Tax=Streptomyces sp. NPDC004546 TaxID=3154282 RepID=UPI0033BE0DBB